MSEEGDVKSLSDAELRRRLSSLVGQSRRVEADVVSHIAEFDERRLYAREAAPSMFAYATEVLHLSEQQAYARIAVARASRKHPLLLTMLRDGRLHLSGIARLAPHLTSASCEAVLKRAVHLSKRQIEDLVAELQPRPDAQASNSEVARTAITGHGGAAGGRSRGRSAAGVRSRWSHHLRRASARRNRGASPRAMPGQSRVRSGATASGGSVRASRSPGSVPLPGAVHRERGATRQARPASGADAPRRTRGDLGAIIEAAVTEKLERLETRRYGRAKAPRKSLADADAAPRSRYIPTPIRRAVYERDGGRCTYVGVEGRRCSARSDLEFHHEEPFGRLGDHSADNIRLACRAHNTLWAEKDYGGDVMLRYRRGGSGVSKHTREC